MKFTHLAAVALFASAGLFAHEGHDHAAAPATSASYPLTTCIVSGDKLGEMGAPVHYTYKQAGQPDRELEFCCKDCIKDFEKDPAKYLAAYDAAVAKQGTTAAVIPAKAGSPGAMAGCCAEGQQGCCELVQAYLPIAGALASDDLAQAKTAAAALVKQAKGDGMTTIGEPAEAIANADSLKTARTAFKQLSQEIEPMVEGAKGYVVMNCPMAQADWIQTDEKVRNPYYGKAMLTCGMPKSPKS